MSVLIRGMEMPFCCLVCPCSGTDNAEDGNEVWICEASKLRQLTTKDKIERRPEWCPLVPVQPHGRLIDADKAFHVLTSYYHHSTVFQREALKEALARVPTVIPAEEGVT